MYDIKPLEEKWERYQKQKRKPYIVSGAIFLCVGAIAALLFYSGRLKPLLNHTRSDRVDIENKSVHFIEEPALDRLEIKENGSPEFVEESSEIIEDLPLSETKPVKKKPHVKLHIVTTEMPHIKRHVEKKEKPHKRIHLAIKETSATSAYKDVARRFRETQDTDDSLFLARTYYNRRAYKKAEYWALQTNNIDNSIEESIFIFVKAKAKRGHKNEAIRILSKYINESNSREARNLLKEIKRGRF